MNGRKSAYRTTEKQQPVVVYRKHAHIQMKPKAKTTKPDFTTFRFRSERQPSYYIWQINTNAENMCNKWLFGF